MHPVKPDDHFVANLFSDALLTRLHEQPEWSKADLLRLLRAEFPDLSDATLTWRIHDLKSRGLLYSAGRGRYVLAAPDSFAPTPSSGPLRMMTRLRTGLPNAACCLSETSWLNTLLTTEGSAPTKLSFTLIEVDRADIDTAFGLLLDFSRKVFLNPDATEVVRFVRLHDRAVIVRPLISEAPTTGLNNITVSSLEKILVDALVHTDLYADYQLLLPLLFSQARDRFNLNLDRLRRYARRRDKLDELNLLV